MKQNLVCIMKENVVGIIAGTGLYKSINAKNQKKVNVKTPFGNPSSPVFTGSLGKTKIAFISRHGLKHTINPSNVNYRANIFALKKLGCTSIISVNAVGSLKKALKPGYLVFADQFIDRTYARKNTFYDKNKVCHINVSEPFCPSLREQLISHAKKLELNSSSKAVYVCIEGPRFSTKAESALYRKWGADIIGMTLCPEASLAREAQICYANISMITDYDNLKAGEEVTVEQIFSRIDSMTEKSVSLLEKTISMLGKKNCVCSKALEQALI